MPYQHETLINQIDKVCRRWRVTVFVRGVAKVLIAVAGSFLLAYALESLVDLDHIVRFLLLGCIVLLFFLFVYLSIIRPARKIPTHTQIARYIEEKHSHLDDRLVTAVELGGGGTATISSEILDKLLEDVNVHVAPLNLSKTIRTTGAAMWGSAAGLAAVFLAALFFSNSDSFLFKSHRIFAPWEIPRVVLTPGLHVFPGNSRVPLGASQDITAELNAFEAESVFLYFSTDDSTWKKLEMEPTDSNAKYEFSFFDVRTPTKYYVKAEDQLSDIFTLTVYDAPHVKQVDLTYHYPKYTGLKTKKEVNTGDIWAPEGTFVKISAITDKPLEKAAIKIGEGRELKTSVSADTVVTASFKVTRDSFYRIYISDLDGLQNEPPPEYFIHALPDLPPVVTVERPGRDVKATMLEEVPVKVRVEDDYGLKSLKLFYAVNSDPEKTVVLRKTKQNGRSPGNADEIQEYSAETLFYLEDMELQPGDFLTYYIQAEDAHNAKKAAIRTDIFFVDIRSFEQEFFRPMSQGQTGGGGGGLGGKLSQTQKDIIVATWKLIDHKDLMTPEAFEEELSIIINSQENLKEVTESTLFQMQQRSLFSGGSGDDLGPYYEKALESMDKALAELSNKQLDRGLTYEMESLKHLGRAEAQMTETQLQRSQSAGAAANESSLDELAQLFEDEMKKLKNKYETPRQNSQQKRDQELEDALRKVKELARRQQQVNRQLRKLANKPLPDEEQKRRIQELRRRQEQLRRETQELSRQDRQSQQSRSISRQMQESLRRASSEMSSSSNNLRQENSDLAAAKGRQALNRLKQLESLLQRNRNESLRKQIESLESEFQQLAQEQKQLTQDLAKLSKPTQNNQDRSKESQRRQAKVKDDFEAAKEHIRQLSERTENSKNKASRELKKLQHELDRANVETAMDRAQNLLKENKVGSAQKASHDIQKMLDRTAKELTKLRTRFAETHEEKLDVALEQTRNVRESLENLKERTQLNRTTDKTDGQPLAREDSQRSSRAGPGEPNQPVQNLEPSQIEWWNEEFVGGIKDLDLIRKTTQSDTSLSGQAQRIGQNLQEIMRTFTGGNPQRFQDIEERILSPLRALEAELAQQLELIKNKEKLFLSNEEEIPAEYKDLVEKYYEALSKVKSKQ
ncbi:MAG: DUF4175 family protein [bacterium]